MRIVRQHVETGCVKSKVAGHSRPRETLPLSVRVTQTNSLHTFYLPRQRQNACDDDSFHKHSGRVQQYFVFRDYFTVDAVGAELLFAAVINECLSLFQNGLLCCFKAREPAQNAKSLYVPGYRLKLCTCLDKSPVVVH